MEDNQQIIEANTQRVVAYYKRFKQKQLETEARIRHNNMVAEQICRSAARRRRIRRYAIGTAAILAALCVARIMYS